MHPLFRKSVCSLMAGLIGFTQTATTVAMAETVTPPYLNNKPSASEITDMGHAANAFGKELGTKGKDGAPTLEGTSIKFQVGDKEMTLDKSELAPKDNGKNIRYAHTEEDFEKQKDLYNDGGGMDETGAEQKDALFTDSESGNPTLEGEVYALLVDIAGKEKPDLSEEQFLKKTEEILGDMENVLQDLVTCDAKSALDTQSKYVHIADLKECQQVIDKTSTCTIQHDYTVGVIEHVDGDFNMKSCGEGCIEIWLGTVCNDCLHGGSCSLFVKEIRFRVVNPDALIKAEIDYAVFDDEYQVWIGPDGATQLVYDSHDGQFPFEPDGTRNGNQCERWTSWAWDVYGDGYGCHDACRNPTPGKGAVNVKPQIIAAGENGIVRFVTRTAAGGNGEGFSRLRIRYDTSKIVKNDIWKPKGCIDAALGIEDGMAEGAVKCTDMPDVGTDGCVWLNGVSVCERHLSESPLKAISPFCRKVSVDAKFTFNKGDTGCWNVLVGFDKNGHGIYDRVCGGENLGGNLDTCTKYKEDPNCKFVSSVCTGGMTGSTTGTCYVNDVVYDCGKDVKIEDVNAETTYDCDGIACLGENCIDVDRTQSTDFAKVNAILNAMQYMAQDMECTGLDENGNPTGNQDVNCTVFGGKSGYCKIAVGGWQDCCEPVGGPGIAEYISMIQAGQRLHSALNSYGTAVNAAGTATSIGAEIAGNYAKGFGEVKAVLQNGVKWFKDAFTSVADNIYGGFTDFLATPLEWFSGAMKSELLTSCQNAIAKVFGDAGFKNTAQVIGGATEGSTGAEGSIGDAMLKDMFGEAMGEAVGSVISFVGWVYLAYQVANLIIQLVYKCEQSEYETVSQRDTKNCHYIGSYCKSKKLGLCIVKHRVYCCYQSPLSRIINEQIKATQPDILSNGGEWGDPEHPKCDGIPLSDITKINWDLINLDEWTALLVSTGNMVEAKDIDLDKLTGKDSKMNWTADQGTATDWGIPNNKDQTDITQKQNVATLGLRADGRKANDRMNTVERIENHLTDVQVDRLRIEGAPCVALEVGNGLVLRGGCGEMSNAEYICRHNGPLIDCEEIAYKNSLNELLNHPLTSKDYWDDGYRCYKGEVNIDCSTLYSKDAYIKALEEYAKIIGGTTYLNRYVCLDKSGKFTSSICEHALEQNSCSCLDGNFICQDGNKLISCSALGNTTSECACMDCSNECPYGGHPEPNNLGVMACACDKPPVCDAKVCEYGGEPAANGTQDCACENAPICTGLYGGYPVGNGTQECVFLPAPNCTGTYGGKPLANGTQECNYYPAPNCTGSYGGEPLGNGTQNCKYYPAPDCSAICEYGGTPKANGTQECNCNTYVPVSAIEYSITDECTIVGGEGPFKCSSKSSRVYSPSEFTTESATFRCSFPKPKCRGTTITTTYTCTDSKGSSASISRKMRGYWTCR